MTSTTRQITRTVVTRSPSDIDPKIAGVFAVAAGTIVLVVAAYLLAALLGKQLDPAIAGYIVPVVLAAAVGYARRSSHAALVDDGVDVAADLVHAVAPVVTAQAPAAGPVVDEVVHGIESLAVDLDPKP